MHAFAETIRQTFSDFHSECSEWEDELRSLFDDVGDFLTKDERAGGVAAAASVAQDVAGLKGLVEQQTEVLSALVNALTGPTANAEAASESEQRNNHRAAPDIELDPFERLQQAIIAASD